MSFVSHIWQLRKIDVTNLDEPERPILGVYTLIEERDLVPITPQNSGSTFYWFFSRSRVIVASIRCGFTVDARRRDRQEAAPSSPESNVSGSEETVSITLLPSQVQVAPHWSVPWRGNALFGIPGIGRRPVPFIPDALPVTNFLSRVHAALEGELRIERESSTESTSHEGTRRYEMPWLIVFETLHWHIERVISFGLRTNSQKAVAPFAP